MEDSGRQAGVHEGQHAPFDEEYATEPQEAVEILFRKALPNLPALAEEHVLRLYEEMQQSAWRSSKLVSGSASYVREVVSSNAERMSNLPHFKELKVEFLPKQECAQLTAFFARDFVGIRIWTTADAVFACGDWHFEWRPQVGANEEGAVGIEGLTVGEVVDMLIRIYVQHPDGVERGTPAAHQLESIGRALDEAGGKQLMLAVHEQFKSKNGWAARNLELMWGGIGEWMG